MTSSQFRWNVMSMPGMRWLLRRPWLPLALQVTTLGVMAWLAVNGWGVGAGEASGRQLVLRKTNLTTLAVWGLWWPAMIALALFLGRAWCTVCPMELLDRAGDAAARSAGWRRFGLPRWMRAGWAIILTYLLMQVLVSGAAIHRVPHFTSIMLAALGVLALASGLAFADARSFCKGLCPAGALLSVYGRYTPVQLDVSSRDVCSTCTTRDCVRAENRHRFDVRSCPSLIRPFHRSQSDGCVLCFQCAKVCPHENVGFGVVAPASTSRQHRPLQPFEAAFVTVAAGFVGHELIGEVAWLDGLFHAPPAALHRLLPGVGFGWYEAVWFLGVFPAALWTLVTGLGRLLGHRGSVKEALLAAATGAAPVIAVAHLAKAVSKVAAWAGYLPLALRDPVGLRTLEKLSSGGVPTPAPLLGLSMLGAMMAMAVLLIAWRSWRWARVAAPSHLPAARAGFVVVTTFFSSVLAIWVGG